VTQWVALLNRKRSVVCLNWVFPETDSLRDFTIVLSSFEDFIEDVTYMSDKLPAFNIMKNKKDNISIPTAKKVS